MANNDISIKVSLDNSQFMKGMQNITKSFKNVKKYADNFNKALETLKAVPTNIVEGVEKLGKGIREAGVYSKILNRQLKMTVTLFRKIKTQQMQVNKALNRSASLGRKLGAAIKKSANDAKAVSKSLEGTMNALHRTTSKAKATFSRLASLVRKYGNEAASAHRKNTKWGERASMMNSKLLRQIARIRRGYYLIGFALSPIRNIIGKVTGAFALLSFAIVRSTNNMDNMIKKASMLNVPVNDLQALSYAADLAGVNFQTLTMAMQRMARRVSQAAGVMKDALEQPVEFSLIPNLREAQLRKAERDLMNLKQKYFQSIGTDMQLDMSVQLGQAERQVAELKREFMETGEAAAAIRELGLDARELNKLNADKQFLKIAEALAKIGNRNDQIRIAQKIWDSEGVRNVLLLTSALKDNIATFNELGAGLSQQQATAVEKFKDSITRLSTVIGSVFNKAIANMAPMLEKGLDSLVGWVKEMGGIEKLAISVGSLMGKFIGYAVKGFGILSEYAADFISNFKKAALGFKEFFTGFLPSVISSSLEGLLGMAIRIVQRIQSVLSKVPVIGKSISKLFEKDIKDLQKSLQSQQRTTIQIEQQSAANREKIDQITPSKALVSFGDTLNKAGDKFIEASENYFKNSRPLGITEQPVTKETIKSITPIYSQGNSFSDTVPIRANIVPDSGFTDRINNGLRGVVKVEVNTTTGEVNVRPEGSIFDSTKTVTEQTSRQVAR